MRKLAPAAFLISGILVFGGLFIATPAQADDDEDTSTTEVVSTPKPHVPRPEHTDAPRPKPSKPPHIKRDELEQKYGKEGKLSLPPLVIRPKRDSDEVTESSAFEVEDDDESSETPTTNTTKVDKTGKASAGSATAGTNGTGSTSQSSGSDAGVGTASAGFIAINPAAKNSLVTSKAGTLVNPKQNVPIEISNVQFTRKTPADMFIQAAQVGLYAMGVGAIALALIAASRAIRRK
jgi:hypothetical protein